MIYRRTGTKTPASRTASLAVLLFLSLFLLQTRLGAQPTDKPVTGTDIRKMFGEEEGTSRFPTTNLSELNPVERRVDPAYYYVGPNDYLMVSTDLAAFPVVVGMDNILVLPRGLTPVDVNGMTLAELEDTLQTVFGRRSAGFGTVKVSLQMPRAIFVNVGGNVIAPGRYIMTSADRVTTAIDAANQVPEELASVDKQLLEISKQTVLGNNSQSSFGNVGLGQSGGGVIRRVVVRHADGTSDEADLIRYRAFGHDRDNPTLREGDQVIVEFPDNFASTVSIAGAVNNSIVGLRYRQGDDIALLLNLAAGFRNDALPREAYVVRIANGGQERVPVNLADSSLIRSFRLMPGDQIIVPGVERETVTSTGVVTVQGEVVFPQTYAIVPGETRLSELIGRAGGFTPFASLNGAYIRRLSDPLALRPKTQQLDPIAGIATSQLNLEDTLRYQADREMQQNLVSADFVSIFRGGDRSKDVILQHGDEIYVPRERGQVYVSGRIRHPGWVSYKSGEKYEYYIAQAGGYTAAAAPDRVQVDKYGTGVWDGVEAEVESGDHIYVPGKRDTPARTALEQAGTILFIAASVLTIINTVIDIINKLSPDNP